MNKNKNTIVKSTAVETVFKKAKEASSKLAGFSASKRNEALKLIALRLEGSEDEILKANKLDMDNAKELVSKGKMSKALADRLKLDSVKIADLSEGIKYLAAEEDPLGKITLARELDGGLELYRVTCPIGLIGIIFESRPDALPQIASLCIKTGNAAILKGGHEAHNSNLKLFELINEVIQDCDLPEHTVTLLESREDVEKMLAADHSIDLIIPRGSNELVKHIQNNTRIPVLGHAEGICHVYIDKDANLQKAVKITVDAKVQYPAACNATETLLIHKNIADEFLPVIVKELINHKVLVKADSLSEKIIDRKDVKKATDEDWSTEYSDLILSIKVVNSIEKGIDHINKYGSNHTETIVTENPKAFEQFFAGVNSAGIFLNASTRFADGFRYGFGAEVGISTGKLHPRGPVGLEGLVTYKYKLLGFDHVVKDYVGAGSKRFTHRDISNKK